jgi:hypothetical protein
VSWEELLRFLRENLKEVTFSAEREGDLLLLTEGHRGECHRTRQRHGILLLEKISSIPEVLGEFLGHLRVPLDHSDRRQGKGECICASDAFCFSH